MTARKIVKSDTRKPAKPKQRKEAKQTLAARVDRLATACQMLNDLGRVSEKAYNKNFDDISGYFRDISQRLDALESRDRLRDKSHDKPVSNNAEAIGWRAPRAIPKQPRWKFWRRGS